MAELMKNDVENLWNEMGNDHSWGSLVRILNQHKDQAKGIDNSTVDMLVMQSKKMQKSGKPFPKSADALHEALSEKVRG